MNVLILKGYLFFDIDIIIYLGSFYMHYKPYCVSLISVIWSLRSLQISINHTYYIWSKKLVIRDINNNVFNFKKNNLKN